MTTPFLYDKPSIIIRITKSLKAVFTTREKSETDIDAFYDDYPPSDRQRWLNAYIFKTSKKIKTVTKLIVEEWLFLAFLGIIMALLSFGMDWTIEFGMKEHTKLMEMVNSYDTNPASDAVFQYLLWVTYSAVLMTCSALFCNYVGPQAVGSGIPEIKTILRGVILKEYLSFRTFCSKIVGLTLALGSGIPIGKEGPFVHIASILVKLMGHLVTSIDNGYSNESRANEMLAAAAAVGVACTFSAPIGGVLFSIEVTSVYFAVRNYWRGFFAATCSATVFRLLRVFNKEASTVIAFYQTNLPRESFLPSELPIFALIGLICGLLSAGFILMQRKMVMFLRKTKFAKKFFQRYWMIYPFIVGIIITSFTFPEGFGRFIGGHQKFSKAAIHFFDNCTFIVVDNTSDRYCSEEIRKNWTDGGNVSIFLTLSLFVVVFLVLTSLASTVPIPSGVFGPSFIIGGAIGRLTGEIVALVWINRSIDVTPGVYAVVGGAAFAGGVTHTVSVAVIVFELTGQLIYILPVMIAVLVANAVSSYFQPSIYDSIIKIKHLPYLPNIPNTSSSFHGVRVEQFMISDVKCLSKTSTYAELEELLVNMRKIKAFPIIEDPKSRILIGSCSRQKLLKALNNHVGLEARQVEANRRVKDAIADVDQKFKMVDKQRSSISETRRPSIFDSFSHVPPPPIIVEIAPSPTENREAFNFSDRRTQSTATAVGTNMNVLDERPRSGSHNPTSKNRFTIVPVADHEPEHEHVPGLRPGGRRGGLSVENTLGPMIALEEGYHTVSTDNKESADRKFSQSSFLSTLTNSIRRDKHRDFLDENSPSLTNSDVYHTLGEMVRNLTKFSFGKFRHRDVDDNYDMSEEERQEWERSRLAMPINFDDVGVDPAPFQLVENSSIFKVHSLFSLLSLNRAYVTQCGRLVGVVALKDLRNAIEKVEEGVLSATSGYLYDDPNMTPERYRLSSSDDDDDDDAENDKLTPCLQIVSRGSQGDANTYAECQDEENIPGPKELSTVKEGVLSVIKQMPAFSMRQPTLITDLESEAEGVNPPSIASEAVELGASNESQENRKGPRHVHICIPENFNDEIAGKIINE